MREYETTIIIQPEISDEGTQAILSKVDGILEAEGATRLTCEDQGKRKLAYEVKKFHKGHYFLLTFLDPGKTIPTLERGLRIEESVLRFLTVQVTDQVADVESRKTAAREFEIEQEKRAADKAAREAEEARAREEVERVAAEEAAQARAKAEEAAAEAAAAAAAAPDADTAEDTETVSETEADPQPDAGESVDADASSDGETPTADEGDKV